MSTTLLDIPLNELMVDPNQPRRVWVQSELDKLASSIAARGILQPLRVVRDHERKSWRIVTGESRWRAAKQAGLASVPCVPVEGELSEADMLADQIVENHCRNDLRPLDLARAMLRLKKLKSCTSQDLAAELGIGGASVSRPAFNSMVMMMGAPQKCVTPSVSIAFRMALASVLRRQTWVPASAVMVQGKHQPLQWNIGSVQR